jgi:hypothetical protein
VHDENLHVRTILRSGNHFHTWCSAGGCFSCFPKAAAVRSCAHEDLLQVGTCRRLFVSSFLLAEAAQVQCCSCNDDVHAWAPSIIPTLPPETFIVYSSRQRTFGGVSSFAIHAGTCYLLRCSARVADQEAVIHVGTHACTSLQQHSCSLKSAQQYRSYLLLITVMVKLVQ